MNEPATDPPEYSKLLVELQTRLTALEREVAMLRGQHRSLASHIPYTPPSEEELRDLLHGPRGLPLRELIAEYEQKQELR
jgi:hypothetical protein